MTFTLICCKNNTDVPTELRSEKEVKTNDKVVILGTSDNQEDLNFINLIDYSCLFSRNYKKDEEVSDLKYKLEIDSISKPYFVHMLLSLNNDFFATQVYLSPGDTISFEIKNGNISFKGKNKVYNNFYGELFRETANYYNNDYKGNIKDYKNEIKKIYKSKLDFLDHYIEDKSITSNQFITTVKDDLKFQYFLDLISPRMKQSGKSSYHGYDESLRNAIQKEYHSKESVFSYTDYLDSVKVKDFNRPELLNNPYFKSSINRYIRYYFDSSDHAPFSFEKLLSEKSFIEDNFSDQLRYFLLISMVSNYMNNGFSYNKIHNAQIRSLLEENIDKIDKLSEHDKEMIEELKTDLNNYDKELSSYALDAELLDQFNNTISLKEILQTSKKKIWVIDFWASWCPPCIQDITEAKKFKDKIAIDYNMEWIYLSIDKSKKNWLQKTKELSHFMPTKHNYLIENPNSPLTASLKVKGIPRFVILNENGKIILNHAPRPSDTLAFERLIKSVKTN